MSQVAEITASNTDQAVASIIATAKGERRDVAVKNMKLSPKNMRGQMGYAQASIEQLAALILSQGGVLQNLTGYEELKKGKKTGVLMIAAGGRRLAAMQWLVQEGKIAEDFTAEVLIIEESVATEISLIENSGREEPHPVDRYMAFRRLIEEEGKSVQETAYTFGVQPLQVERSLRLGRLHPSFHDLFRENKISIEQLMALALTEDQKQQVEVWKSLPSYNRSAYLIKQSITNGEINIATHRLGLYVGADAYIKAGGNIRPDLFEEGHGYVNDNALLNRLATEKMGKTEQKMLKAGASFVEIHLEGDSWTFRDQFKKVPGIARDMDKKEAKKLSDLEAKLETARMACAAAEEEDEHDKWQEASEAFDAIEEEIDAFNASLVVPDPYFADKTGAVLYINDQGKLVKLENVVRVEDLRRQTAEAKGENPDEQRSHGRPAMSERLVRLLTAHRTVAVQAAYVAQPQTALAFLVSEMLADKFAHNSRSIHFHVRSAEIWSCDPEKTIAPSRAGEFLDEQEQRWEGIFEAEISADPLAWALKQTTETLLDALAFCTAPGYSSIQVREDGSNAAEAHMKAFGVNMAEWWQPTAANMLNLIPKAKKLEIVTEAKGAEAAAGIANFKKDALTGAAEELLAGSGWVPSLFRLV